MNDYEQQAQDFLTSCNAILDVEYQYTGPHFNEDEDQNVKRDVYRFTIKTPRCTYSADYGDSIRNTERKAFALQRQPLFSFDRVEAKKLGFNTTDKEKLRAELISARNHKPSAYDILACLTKYDPGTFQDFCSDCGYDTDSRKAERTYFAVQQEWESVRKCFTHDQIEQLAEIN